MNKLHGARTCRWDLLHSINTLAREVTKWNKKCDIRLHKLMCYIRGTLEHSLESFCGDRPETLKLIVYCDADFAGDTRASKSTSGSYIAPVGPNTFMPIASLCKKQPVVSHSSTESEIISMEIALRSEAIPILSFWDLVVDVFDPPKTSSGGGAIRDRDPPCFKISFP